MPPVRGQRALEVGVPARSTARSITSSRALDSRRRRHRRDTDDAGARGELGAPRHAGEPHPTNPLHEQAVRRDQAARVRVRAVAPTRRPDRDWRRERDGAVAALVNSATPVVNVPYVRTSSRRRSRSRSELPATHAAMERGRTPRCARCGACSRSGSSGSAAAQQGTVTALLHTTSRRSSSRTHAASWILELSPEEQRAADAHYPRLVCRFANRRREDEALRWCYLSVDGDALPGDALGPRSRSLLVPQHDNISETCPAFS